MHSIFNQKQYTKTSIILILTTNYTIILLDVTDYILIKNNLRNLVKFCVKSYWFSLKSK